MKKMKQLFQYVTSLLILFFIVSCSKSSDENNGGGSTVTSVTDIDGNVYNAITIGSQTWMTENLKTTHYRNGDAITELTSSDFDDWDKIVTGGWTCYNDDAVTNIPIYGRLYNWRAVNDSRGLAPAGWHIPTDNEWKTLISFLGNTAVAGGKMKSTSTLWISPNTDATNSSGFSAIPGGYRHYNGAFTGIGEQAYWWSSTERNADYSYYYTIFNNYAVANQNNNKKNDLMSIRCVKD